jgi:hypothetical protein
MHFTLALLLAAISVVSARGEKNERRKSEGLNKNFHDKLLNKTGKFIITIFENLKRVENEINN